MSHRAEARQLARALVSTGSFAGRGGLQLDTNAPSQAKPCAENTK